MNSIVEQACNSVNGHSAPDAFNLIEQQAERIKELEAELASIAEGVKISVPTQTMEQEFQNHYRRGYEAGKAALRQRIADAPVVAWCVAYDTIHGTRIHSDPSMYEPNVDAHVEQCGGRIVKAALISKEDI